MQDCTIHIFLFICLFCGVVQVLGQNENDLPLYNNRPYSCPYFGDQNPQNRHKQLSNCSWYDRNCCCQDSEQQAVIATALPYPGASHTCIHTLNLLFCYPCSPDQWKWYINETLVVCPSFCDRLYSACKSASIDGELIQNRFTTGPGLCQYHQFKVDTTGTNHNCFNSGNSLVPIATLSGVFVLLAVF